jgi:membrane protease YdiL (CAAX protease family)
MVVTVLALVVVQTLLVAGAHFLLYPKMPWPDLARVPEVILLSQFVLYGVIFAIMHRLLRLRAGGFWEPLRWNWPSSSWLGFLCGGALLYFVLAGFSMVLPIPKHLPIDQFFETPRQASIMSVFAVTLAPLMEELFFRGFLYPVLARRLGMVASILLTAAAFGLLHGAQLKYSWAVFIIFLVGLALTIVRAVTKSVAASFLIHVGYNGTLSVLLFVGTDGFRHLEKLNQ